MDSSFISDEELPRLLATTLHYYDPCRAAKLRNSYRSNKLSCFTDALCSETLICRYRLATAHRNKSPCQQKNTENSPQTNSGGLFGKRLNFNEYEGFGDRVRAASPEKLRKIIGGGLWWVPLYELSLTSLEWNRVDLERQTAWLDQTRNGTPRGVPLNSDTVAVLEGQVGQGNLATYGRLGPTTDNEIRIK